MFTNRRIPPLGRVFDLHSSAGNCRWHISRLYTHQECRCGRSLIGPIDRLTQSGQGPENDLSTDVDLILVHGCVVSPLRMAGISHKSRAKLAGN